MAPRTARPIATVACQALTPHNIFFRSAKSAIAPAGSVNKEKGSDENVAMRGRRNAAFDLARESKTQKAAVPWAAIALPEITFAIQSLLKAALPKAVQVDVCAIDEASGFNLTLDRSILH